MKKIFLAMLFLLMMIFTGCGGESLNGGNEKTYVIGLDDEYKPMGFHDEKGELVGFDIDLANEAAKRLGVKFEFKPINWKDKERELTSGKIDIIWNGLDIAPERKGYILYSKPYMDNRQIILVTKGNTQGITSETDLAGKKIGTQAGSTSETYIDQNTAFKDSLAEFRTYGNYKTALKDLEKGVVDALVCDEILSRYEVGQNPDKFEIIDVTIGSATEIAIGFRKDEIELRDEVQKIFDEMVTDGTAKKISEKWFKADMIKFDR
ncbi:MAG: amino acid ABC transporter substrate-binding protein [Selenomonadaceae bacterium]|nr:amino acid ABC transporter substrate-binding protein [Selenomonadaceae bacterium]